MHPLVYALVLVLVEVLQRVRRDVSHLSYGKPEEDHGCTRGKRSKIFSDRAANSQKLPLDG